MKSPTFNTSRINIYGHIDTASDIVQPLCKEHPNLKFMSPEHCAQYYDCKDTGGHISNQIYLQECPYPQLFDFESNMCSDHPSVKCGARFEPLSPCDYGGYKCEGPDCQPCQEQVPGCLGQPDGVNAFPGRLLTSRYLICKTNQTVSIETCATGVFDPVQGKCTMELDPLAIEIFCASNPSLKFKNPSSCARYYDCSQTTERQWLGKYEMECIYPQLFSDKKEMCDDFRQVNCGRVPEPKAPCAYLQNQCNGPDCVPCEDNNPSCVGLPDGPNVILGKEMSPVYMICFTERTVEMAECQRGFIFDPFSKNCTINPRFGPGAGTGIGAETGPGVGTSTGSGVGTDPVSNGGVGPGTGIETGTVTGTGTGTGSSVGVGTGVESIPVPATIPAPILSLCKQNTAAVVQSPTNCAQFYNCSIQIPTPGFPQYMSECPYPQLFSMDTMKCENFPQVACGQRTEPKAPCEYVTSQSMCTGPLCVLPCIERSPSCIGLSTGNNTFPGRELSPFYITCVQERTLAVGICRYGVYDPTLRRCTADLDPNSVAQYCSIKGNVIFPHVANCARFYDCSATEALKPFGPYLRECPYPTLFSIETLTCVDYRDANCRWRVEPKEPCEYMKNAECADPTNCPPCEQRFPSCMGLPDGNNTFPVAGREQLYLVCRDGRTMAVESCPSGTFDVVQRMCTSEFDLNNPLGFCTNNPTAIIPHPGDCAQYFDCRLVQTQPGELRRECPYPQLFSVTDNVCRYYTFVTCGTRREPKSPCEYEINQRCPGDVPNCVPCEERLPSCIGYSNGNHSFPTRNEYYVVCQDERTLSVQSCEPGIFDKALRRCSVSFDIKRPSAYCVENPTEVVPSPGNCAQYYDCRQQNTPLGDYLQECPYPMLYSTLSRGCQPFPAVNCETREEPQSPCDYVANQCREPNCRPCAERFVSCVGKRDGNNTYPGREMSQFYVQCLANRTIGVSTCTSGFFDNGRRTCTRQIDAASIRGFCQSNKGMVKENPLNCAQYFDCSDASVQAGTYLRECPYPMLFSTAGNVCQNFSDVACGNRMEPKSPCQFLQNQCNPGDPNCTPCSERLPSCSGLQDGNNPFPDRPMSGDYITCFRERTISIEKCTNSVFDPLTRSCRRGVDENSAAEFCRANADTILPHPLNCAQYYDCRQAVGGSYLRECRYPQLFDIDSLTCRNFSDVICGRRYEPFTPCDYLQNQCPPGSQDCVACDQRLPSCVNLADGHNPFPGRPNTEFYIRCYKNRTVAVEVCQVSLYDPAKKACSDKIHPPVLVRFCQQNRNVLIPHPENCARYYNCSDEATKQGLSMPYLSECKYPRLFASAASGCQLFTEVECTGRYEPKAPCEYVENQCFDGPAQCEPCELNYPSCVGKLDGSNEYPGRVGSQYYIVCYRERTVAIVTCTLGFYNHNTRSCEVIEESSTPGPPVPPAAGTPA
ncbi:hypothetical protein ScPMuIL_018959 [Solemya velum]